jgi:hypothetical protein
MPTATAVRYKLQSGTAFRSSRRFPRAPEIADVDELDLHAASFRGFHTIDDFEHAAFKVRGAKRYYFQTLVYCAVPIIDPHELDEFTKAYIECALWAENDNADDSGGEPLDQNYSVDDFDQDALLIIKADCERFQRENAADLIESNCLTSGVARGEWTVDGQAGHDFWLTRNGHGCGFWETSDWREESGKRLTQASKRFGQCTIDAYRGKLSLFCG